MNWLLNLADKKWWKFAWIVFMLVLFVTNTFVNTAHADCGWTDPGANQAIELGFAVAAVYAGIGLFFPPALIASGIIGGICGAQKVAMMLTC